MEKIKIPSALHRIVGRYVRAFAPERIILYGSYAKGNNHAGSDLDVLIVAQPMEAFSRPYARARQLAADCFPPVDVVFATPLEVAEATPSLNPFLLSVLQSGITLYEKGVTEKNP